jgi:signal transduction histidine kinase
LPPEETAAIFTRAEGFRPIEEADWCLVVPLLRGEEVTGLLALEQVGHCYAQTEEAQIAFAFANHATVAIANARLFEHSQRVAMLEERDRLARDMHDGLAQTLGFLTMKLDTAQTHLTASQAREVQADLARMRQVVGQAYEDLREAIVGLKETARPGVTLESLIRERLSRLYGAPGSDDGVTVELITAPEWADGLSPRATAQIAEIVQEALTNVYKHAQTRHAWVRLNRQGTEAQIVVEDDGRGLPGGPSEAHEDGRPHFGLTGMRERAESIGGRLTVSARPGGGVRVSVAVDLLPIKASFADYPPSD